MQIVRIFIATTIFGALLGLTWITADVYALGFGLGLLGTRALHIVALFFWTVLLFSFFSGRMSFAQKIRPLFIAVNILFGFIIYLFPAAVMLSVIFALTPYSQPLFAELSALATAGACILSIWGIIQTQTIRITRHTVTLPAAPASWNGKVAVVVSDTHFGLVRGAAFSKKVTAAIERINPAFVIHAGDFYDGPNIDTAPIVEPWRNLAARVPLFYTSGNHELYGNYDAFIASVRSIGANVLLDERTLHDGVQIAGITYRGKLQSGDASDAIRRLSLDPTLPSILINHPPTFHASAAKAGVSLMLSGHTHNGQFWPFMGIIRLFYGKYTYGKKMFQHMTALTTRGVGTTGPPMRLFNPPELVVITFGTK